MATLNELSIADRLFVKTYPFKRYALGAIPAAPLTKPLRDARLAIVTTAGLYPVGQHPFDTAVKGGDPSFREIPETIAVQELLESHKSNAFDPSGIAADRNLVFPIDRFRELAARGEIGGLNWRHFSFMGSITKPEKLIAETSREAARLLKEDGVDAVFLTPV